MSTLRGSLTYEPVELNFGTSGLRGLVVDMTDLECYLNTVGFLKFLETHDNLQPGATVYLAGDLRDSTPRIMQAVQAACEDNGYKVVYLGLIPTPALALYALKSRAPGIMVTGSHIPADRNGIKFYKSAGEVLKGDEAAIKENVAAVRITIYNQAATDTQFDAQGFLKKTINLPGQEKAATTDFLNRFTTIFAPNTFQGKKIVFYQHSAVGRDLITDILIHLGAEVIPVGRSDVFIPIDSENVTPEHKDYFRRLTKENPDCFAIISTDGDSDRPFVIDETGEFHRGDVLGAVVAAWLKADFAACTATTSDAATDYLTAKQIDWEQTKIGSPYVVEAMIDASAAGKLRPTGWEVNGGFMTGSQFKVNGQELPSLPTRDATLPILVALIAALEANLKISELFEELPKRYTSFAQIGNFPTATAKAIVAHFSEDNDQTRKELAKYFKKKNGFGQIKSISTIDGVRILFASADVFHMRPSGNAPDFRAYSIADSQSRADEIVALAIAEPDGLYRQMEKSLLKT
ncbi:MAG: phosphomannomutase [Patescibacteria group bacterium]